MSYHQNSVRNASDSGRPIDEIDRLIIVATQAGLPLVEQPYEALAEKLGIEPDEILDRMQAMLAAGIIRRIGAVPNHYALGYRANAMSVWNVVDDMITECGKKIGQLDFVSHCYHRPRHLPIWPYNLFAMVHGRTRGEAEAQVEKIAGLLGAHSRGHELLYSTRILKKAGLRIKNRRSDLTVPGTRA